jgi:hypothetical protein
VVCGRSDDHLQALAPLDLHHQLHHSPRLRRTCHARGCTPDAPIRGGSASLGQVHRAPWYLGPFVRYEPPAVKAVPI